MINPKLRLVNLLREAAISIDWARVDSHLPPKLRLAADQLEKEAEYQEGGFK